MTITALVVSSDPAVRSDWARFFDRLGLRTMRCVGPQAMCGLLDGGRCPLHDAASIAVYDRASLTPELTLRLIRAARSIGEKRALSRQVGTSRTFSSSAPVCIPRDALMSIQKGQPLISATRR